MIFLRFSRFSAVKQRKSADINGPAPDNHAVAPIEIGQARDLGKARRVRISQTCGPCCQPISNSIRPPGADAPLPPPRSCHRPKARRRHRSARSRDRDCALPCSGPPSRPSRYRAGSTRSGRNDRRPRKPVRADEIEPRARPCRAALRRATSSAAALISVATPCASGHSARSVTAMIPLPVPRSSSRAGAGPRSASAIRHSVSGRGSSTSASPQSCAPRTRAAR